MMIKIEVEKYLQELEMLVNMDSGLGNPEGITAVGKYFADRLAEAGWICEQVDVGAETGKCTVVKNREADHYDALLIGHVDTVFPTGETAKRPFRRDEKLYFLPGDTFFGDGFLSVGSSSFSNMARLSHHH